MRATSPAYDILLVESPIYGLFNDDINSSEYIAIEW